MEWEQWFCPNRYCATETWMVQPSRDISELWTVASRFDGMSYNVAATDPVCPHCGTTLCATVELGQRISGAVLESGKMLDYVRSLR